MCVESKVKEEFYSDGFDNHWKTHLILLFLVKILIDHFRLKKNEKYKNQFESINSKLISFEKWVQTLKYLP